MATNAERQRRYRARQKERTLPLREQPVTLPVTLVAPLRVVSEDGRALLFVSHTPEGAMLTLFDANGKPVAALVADPRGGALLLSDEKGVVTRA